VGKQNLGTRQPRLRIRTASPPNPFARGQLNSSCRTGGLRAIQGGGSPGPARCSPASLELSRTEGRLQVRARHTPSSSPASTTPPHLIGNLPWPKRMWLAMNRLGSGQVLSDARKVLLGRRPLPPARYAIPSKVLPPVQPEHGWAHPDSDRKRPRGRAAFRMSVRGPCRG